MLCGFKSLVLHAMELIEPGGAGEFLLFALPAAGLDLLQLFENFCGTVEKAVKIHAEPVEGAGVLAEGFGIGGSIVHFRAFQIEIAGNVFHEAESEHAVLDRGGAVDAPLEVGVALGQLTFVHIGRREGFDQGSREGLEGVQIRLGQDDNLPVDAVTARG